MIGSPIYGVPGTDPEPSYGGGPWENPDHISLGFGPWDERIVVETSTKPVTDHRMVMEMLLNAAPVYPLTIEERSARILIDEVPINYRILWIADRAWSGAAKVAERWVYLRGIGASLDEVVVGSIL